MKQLNKKLKSQDKEDAELEKRNSIITVMHVITHATAKNNRKQTKGE